MNEQEQKKLDRLLSLRDDVDLSFQDDIDSLKETDIKLAEDISGVKVQVKDITAKIDEVQKMEGQQGIQGEKGEKGEQGIAGIDGIGIKGDKGDTGEQGLQGEKGTDGKDGIDGKDGSPDTPVQIVEKINTLKEVIEPDVIKGFREVERIAKANAFNPTMGPSFSDLVNINKRIDNLPAGASIGGSITGGTANSILFVNPTGILAQDNANFSYTSGALFVGTSITSPLHIGGSGTTQTLTYKTTTGVGATGADHIFQVGNNGATEAMRIFNNGRVSIGTTLSGNQLTVAGSSSATIPSNAGVAGIRVLNSNTTDNNFSSVDFTSLRTTALTEFIGSKIVGQTTAHADASESGQMLFYTRKTGSVNLALTLDSSQNATFAGNISLPATTATVGQIKSGSNLLLHSFGTSNIFAGITAGNLTLTNVENSGIGQGSLTALTSGTRNTAIGASALTAMRDGNYNTAIGAYALAQSVSDSTNTAIGNLALYSTNGGSQNVAVGYNALANNTTGSGNIVVGYAGMQANTTGGQNISIGAGALASNTTASNGIGIGYAALFANTTGFWNTAIGNGTLSANVSGYGNTAVGESTLTASTGIYTTAIGRAALYASTGDGNSALGASAGSAITTGTYNTILGYSTFNTGITTGSNNIIIGYDVRNGLGATTSNQLNIGNLLFGTGLGSDTTLATGNIGILTASPTNILSLGGNSARTIWMERHTTANTAGNTLTLQAGGATSGATNKAGGNLILAPGLSTGTGNNQILFQTSTPGASGTADNALVTRATLDSTALVMTVPVTLKGYTVATLPAGTQGMTAFVTDSLAPAWGVAVVGGGAARAMVWYNNANWTVTGI